MLHLSKREKDSNLWSRKKAEQKKPSGLGAKHEFFVRTRIAHYKSFFFNTNYHVIDHEFFMNYFLKRWKMDLQCWGASISPLLSASDSAPFGLSSLQIENLSKILKNICLNYLLGIKFCSTKSKPERLKRLQAGVKWPKGTSLRYTGPIHKECWRHERPSSRPFGAIIWSQRYNCVSFSHPTSLNSFRYSGIICFLLLPLSFFWQEYA